MSGAISGGTGGFDSFAVEDPAHPGTFTVIVPDSTDEHTLTVSDIFGGDSRTITYSEMEPSLSVDATDPENITVNVSLFDDEMVLSSGPAAGQLQLHYITDSTEPVQFWNVSAGGYAEDTLIFDIPSRVSHHRFAGR